MTTKNNDERFAYAAAAWGYQEKAHVIDSCRDLREIGYRNVELVQSLTSTFPSMTEFGAVLKEYDIRPVSFYFMLNLDLDGDIRDMHEKIEAFAKFGATNLTVQGIWDEIPANEAELVAHLNTVNIFADAARQYGMTVAIHPHHHTKLMTESDIAFIMENTDPAVVGLCPDTAHLVACKIDPVKFINQYQNRIFFTHLKDIENSAYYFTDAHNVVDPPYAAFRELGEGDIDLKSVFAALKDGGYSGWLCAETDGTRTTTQNSAKINLSYLRTQW